MGCRKWGCNKWGLKGCLAALSGNRPKSAFFTPFSAFFAPFRRVRRAPGNSRKRRKKAFFLRFPQICLNPYLLNPHLRHSNSGPLFGEQFISTQSGFQMGCCQRAEMGPTVGFCVQKWVEKWVERKEKPHRKSKEIAAAKETRISKIGRKHPSRDVIFSGQKFGHKFPK